MVTALSDDLLDDLGEALDVPDDRYASADRSYQSVANWLRRQASPFADLEINLYIQGSFRLGTATRPVSDAEDYDLDVVCEVQQAKTAQTQHELKDALGQELVAYAAAHSMEAPEPSRRVWTLNYADGAQFHMDVLPSVPDGVQQRLLLERLGLASELIGLAVGIADEKHPNYRLRTDDWPTSNPNGYARWFLSRQAPIFEARRRALALKAATVNVEDIPAYRVRTPLQRAVQILKRHRDLYFSDLPEARTNSIILTTLAARAYRQEVRIAHALSGILARLEEGIERRQGVHWIANPADPRENFADMWEGEPERREAFYDWLAVARADFAAAAASGEIEDFVEKLAPRLGRQLVEQAIEKRRGPNSLAKRANVMPIADHFRRLLDAPHRKPVRWPQVAGGRVTISGAQYQRNGFRPQQVGSDSELLPKHGSITFEAQTNVMKPFQVYWQIVNTGSEAARARNLRGGFDEAQVERGNLIRKETTLYAGTHSIECFIVKDGYCVAKSGPFVVNIA